MIAEPTFTIGIEDEYMTVPIYSQCGTRGARGLIDFGRGTLVLYSELFEEILDLIREDAERIGYVAEVEHPRQILPVAANPISDPRGQPCGKTRRATWSACLSRRLCSLRIRRHRDDPCCEAPVLRPG